MQPDEFMRTLYLGDRAVNSIEIDCCEQRVYLRFDCISRIQEGTGQWNFYTEEDILDGAIVMTGVNSFVLHPTGALPNDFVSGIDAVRLNETEFLFSLYAGRVDEGARWTDVVVRVVAKAVHLDAPFRPADADARPYRWSAPYP